jgi:hypothetical protein
MSSKRKYYKLETYLDMMMRGWYCLLASIKRVLKDATLITKRTV